MTEKLLYEKKNCTNPIIIIIKKISIFFLGSLNIFGHLTEFFFFSANKKRSRRIVIENLNVFFP